MNTREENTDKATLSIGTVAAMCHESNAAYCRGIGDATQPEWDDAPKWQRDSAMDGVLNIISGVVTKPSDSHESWMEEKRRHGWTYGKTKDVDAKTHPCFVPYEELPAEQKAKDYIFFNLVTSLIEVGML